MLCPILINCVKTSILVSHNTQILKTLLITTNTFYYNNIPHLFPLVETVFQNFPFFQPLFSAAPTWWNFAHF